MLVLLEREHARTTHSQRTRTNNALADPGLFSRSCHKRFAATRQVRLCTDPGLNWLAFLSDPRGSGHDRPSFSRALLGEEMHEMVEFGNGTLTYSSFWLYVLSPELLRTNILKETLVNSVITRWSQPTQRLGGDAPDVQKPGVSGDDQAGPSSQGM